MRKKSLLILMLLLPTIILSSFGQEPPMASMRVPYRQVIISEYDPARVQSYLELTNVGDSTVNLKHFDWWHCDQRSVALGAANVIRDAEGNLLNAYFLPTADMTRFWMTLPDHLLKPGESFVISQAFDRTYPDGTLLQREKMVEKSNALTHPAEPLADSTIYNSYYPEYGNFDFDSTGTMGPYGVMQGASTGHLNISPLSLSNNGRSMLRHRIFDAEGVVIDSIAIDGFKLVLTETGAGDWDLPNIAGIEQATRDHMLVRKYSIKYGNLNWNLSAGVSAENSEWLPIPRLPATSRNIYTTVGIHGIYSPSATSDNIGIDFTGETLTVPWGIYKINNGDSIFNYMTLGPGMAWMYVQNSENFDGGGHTIIQEGDTLVLYTVGDVLDKKNMRMIVQAPAASETRVFPRRSLNYPDPTNPLATLSWGDMPYYVTQYNSIMDTVGNIPFGARRDSLFKYLEKAEQASWEILWVDGRPRVDLLKGDILKVTAGNGTDTKEYYLDLLPFTPNDNAFLSSITWPDKPGFMMNWVQDTIPRFDSRITRYNISLPYQHEGVPALQTTTQEPNAKVEIFPAINIDGSISDRTTHIKVTAQDDSTVLDYYIVFKREQLSDQAWEAEPIITEVSRRAPTAASAMVEIFNPGTVPIDLSNYMIRVDSDPLSTRIFDATTMTTASHWNSRYGRGYIPGFKWPNTLEDYLLKPGFVVFDPVIDPILEPGETFVFYATGSEGPAHWVNERADAIFITGSAPAVAWEEFGGNQWGEWTPGAMNLDRAIVGGRTTWLLKVLNDSIQQGLKPIRDVEDFEIIDIYGKTPGNQYFLAGKAMDGNNVTTIIRKPYIYLPNTENMYNWGPQELGPYEEMSDWIVIRSKDTHNGVEYTQEMVALDFGYHTFDEVTFFRSVVYSNVYKVDKGFEGSLSISGVSSSENVQAFLNNLIKADAGQTLVVSATVGGTAKELTEAVAANDVLTVTSQDGLNQTVYTISLAPLNSDNTLTLASGSSLVLTREGNTGTVSGFPFGTTISSIFEQVEKPALASLTVVDANGQLLPLNVLNTDTVKVPAVVDNQTYFKVTAENGTSALYNLQSTSLASDAYVLSDIYVVDQVASTINVVPGGTAVGGFLANLKPVPGATMQVRNKAGGERNMGEMNFDDFLYVTSPDQSVTKVYFIQFIGETEGLQDEFRTIAPAPTNLTLTDVAPDGSGAAATIAWNHESGMEFGFVITRDGVPVDTVFATTFTDPGLVKGTTYQYSVYAYNEFGNSGAVALNVQAWPTAVEQNGADGISIYPNVTTDRVYFSNVPENSRIVLIDLTGRSILIKNASELKDGLSLQPYANGYYLIRVMQGQENVKSVKVLKK